MLFLNLQQLYMERFTEILIFVYIYFTLYLENINSCVS